jgi:redox-sensitive bicupin YhaK (pirin superfamily)
VMNSEEELMQAVRDFQSGRMGEITREAKVG